MHSRTSRNLSILSLLVLLPVAALLAAAPVEAGSRAGQGFDPASGRKRVDTHRSSPPQLRLSPTKPRQPPTVSADQAMRLVRSGQRVLLPAEAGASQELVDALVRRSASLGGKKPVEVLHAAAHLEQPTHATGAPGKLQVNALFINGGLRQNLDKITITPTYLSEIPRLVTTTLKPNVVFLRVSPPDARGYVSMGPNADYVLGLLADPKVKIIAEVNPNVPRTRGDSRLHVSHIDALVASSKSMPQVRFEAKDQASQLIAKHVAAAVPNGATLQLGIGELQEAVAGQLAERGKQLNDKGGRFRVKVWTEIGSNGLKVMADAGIIAKQRDAIKLGFGIGEQPFYDFLAKDKRVKLVGTATINDPMVAGARRKLVAVNSGVGVDLYGQACSEMIPRTGPDGKVTPVPYSGVGGQVDFFRAVQRSPGGMGFLTLRSTVKNGTVSTITLDLAPGLVVTTNRYDMDRVATEWGVAELRGKDVVARAQALIRVAHPRFRAELARQGLERFGGDPKSWQIASRVTQAEQRLVAQLEPAPVTTASK